MDNTEMKVEVELTAAQKLAQMEKEKLTRRQALARFGFQAGAAAVAALTADELLRKVGKEMQRRAGDNKVAQQVAKELNGAGVAFADVTGVEDPEDGIVLTPCEKCVKTKNKCMSNAARDYNVCLSLGFPESECSLVRQGYEKGCRMSYCVCCNTEVPHCNCGC